VTAQCEELAGKGRLHQQRCSRRARWIVHGVKEGQRLVCAQHADWFARYGNRVTPLDGRNTSTRPPCGEPNRP
jgi:hypothetical protein